MWFAGEHFPAGGGVSIDTLGTAGFMATAIACTVALAALWVVLSRRLARHWHVAPALVRNAIMPLLWGVALPLLSLALDGVSFWPSAPPLAALGIGVGGLLMLRRLALLDVPVPGAAADCQRLALASVAVALPMILLFWGWSPPSGDEPNYLVVAHSIAFDGDLDLADEFRQREYAAFHPAVLSPHYRPGLRDGSRYSMHGIGLPVLIAPAYALGSVFGGGAMVALPRALLIVLYGAFTWVLYGFLLDVTTPRAARYGSAATVLLAPLVFAPVFVFAEAPAMLLSLWAFRGLHGARGRGTRYGLALAALPFVGVKYIPLAAAIFLVGIWATPRAARLGRALHSGVPLALGLMLHGLFTWRLYGSLSPASIYLGAGDQAGSPALGGDWVAYLAAWPAAMATVVGYLLDQKEGLLAYGPHFILACAGVAWLVRHRPRLCGSLVLISVAYVGPYALSQQLGGQGPPVRPLMAVIWVLAPALGVALARAGDNRAYAALRGGLLALSAALTLAYAAQPQLLPHDYPVVASRLLQNYSPYGSGWWRYFPQWVNIDDPNKVVTLAWTLVVALLAWALWRHGVRAEGTESGLLADESRAALTSLRAAVVVVALTCGYVLVHHVAIVRTDRHRPTPMDNGLVVWLEEELPPVAFAEAGGVWATAGAPVDFIVASSAPLTSVDVSLRVLVPASVGAVLQGAVIEGTAAPGAQQVARLRPGRGRADGSGYAYHARLRASDGAAPSDLTGGEDERHLGVFLQLFGIELP